MLLRQNRAALRARESLANPYDPGAAMPPPRADPQPAAPTLRIRRDSSVAVVRQQLRLIRGRLPVRFLEQAALLAAAIAAEGPIGKDGLAWPEFVGAAAPGAHRLARCVPPFLPVGFAVRGDRSHGGKVGSLACRASTLGPQSPPIPRAPSLRLDVRIAPLIVTSTSSSIPRAPSSSITEDGPTSGAASRWTRPRR